MRWIFLSFRHFCVFLVHFEVCFSNIREPSNIFNGIFAYISFWTPVPWIKVCLSINLSVHRSVQHFSQESVTTFFLIFCTMVDDWNNKKLTESFFSTKILFCPNLDKKVPNDLKIGFLTFSGNFVFSFSW